MSVETPSRSSSSGLPSTRPLTLSFAMPPVIPAVPPPEHSVDNDWSRPSISPPSSASISSAETITAAR